MERPFLRTDTRRLSFCNQPAKRFGFIFKWVVGYKFVFNYNYALTASVILPKTCSGIGVRRRLSNLSKQVVISSMHIQTSASVIKQPRHCTM